jgi:hypothetical protein
VNVTERSFGWLGALGRGAVVLGVGFGLLVVGPQLILTQATGFARSGRVAVASIWFTVWLVVLAVAMRRLQERRVL